MNRTHRELDRDWYDRESLEYLPGKSLAYSDKDEKYGYYFEIEEVPDRILCAAIHFVNHLPAAGNGGAVNLPLGVMSGIVVAGRRHSDCLAVYLALTGQDDIGDKVDGFRTVSNRLDRRVEAFQIAKAAKQLLSHVDLHSDRLCSEMLYFD